METWNFDELRKLCRDKGLSEESISAFSTYATSLDWRYLRAKVHAEQANKILENLFSKPFSFGDNVYNEAEFLYEAQVEACIQSLHAMADILSQIINIVILGNRFSEDEISLKKIVFCKARRDINNELLEEILNLINSDEFKYIDAFCNTIKHRKIIHTEFRAEYGESYRNEEGIVFEEFMYKETMFPKTWAIDIIDKYREKIFELIINIGIKLNEFHKNGN